MEDLDHLTANDEEIFSWCCRWKNAVVTSGSGKDRLLCSTSNILVKINDAAVVKFGSSVTASDAANQSYAYNALASAGSQISVPQVYKYFERNDTDGRIGYLVMEHIRGKLVADVSAKDFQDSIAKVSTAVQAMWQLVRDKPGPIDGGEPYGTIWAPDSPAYETFMDKRDLEM